MKYNEWYINELLGEGGYGKVYLGINKRLEKVALKFISKNINDCKIKREITSLRTLNHKNIIRLINVDYDAWLIEDSGEKKNYICIITEYVSGGELFSYLL